MKIKKETTIKIAKIILKIIAAAGFLSMALLAPNAVRAINMFYGKEKRKYYLESYVKKTITKLKEKGLIEFRQEGNKTFARLTAKGRQELLRYQIKEKIIEKPRKWDGKWRIIIFDIKEQKRNIRNRLREELVNLGFLRLQNSVWIYPYECEEAIILLKSYFHLGKDALYMTVEKMENDKWLRKRFGLER